ncbi:MAG: FecR domain-containing protein [Luteolibacter sp.]
MNDAELLKLSALCDSLVDGTITSGQKQELEGILLASEEARRHYVRLMDLSASLRFHAAEMQSESVAAPVPFWVRHRRGLVGMAAALIATAGLTLWRPWSGGRAGVALEIVSSTSGLFKPGQHLVRKEIELGREALRFRLSSGAVVDVEGPASISLLSPLLMHVVSGSVTADVGEDAKGFAVTTNSARVVDLGTRFGVSINPKGDTDVVVFEGEVEVHPPPTESSDRQIADLNEGEAIQVDARQTAKRLSAIPLREDSRAMLSPDAARDLIVTGVTDNIIEAGDRRFYGILPGGMREGARPYVAAYKPRWQPLPGKSFPAELTGADLIATFAADRRDSNHQITLEVAKPCTVYIMADTRTPPPEWLTRDFRDSGLRLRSGPWGPDSAIASKLQPDAHGRYFVGYAVWSRKITSPGRVTLGPPRGNNTPSQHAMYGIAVKAAE